MRFILFIAFCARVCSSLYEDQFGKFDWRQQYIGKLLFTNIDPLSSGIQKFIVATEQNVLAAINTRTGTVAWRQILEKGEVGKISELSKEGDVITVNGNGQHIRSWDGNTGLLLWEVTIPTLPGDSEKGGRKFYLNSKQSEVVVMYFDENRFVKVALYNLKSSTLKTSDPIYAPWLEIFNCEFLSTKYLVCFDKKNMALQLLVMNGNNFISVSLETFGIKASDPKPNVKVISFPHQSKDDQPIFAVQLGNDGFAVLQLQPPGVKLLKVLPGTKKLLTTVIDNKLVLFTLKQLKEGGYKVIAVDPFTWMEITDLEGYFELPPDHGNIENCFIMSYIKKDRGYGYKLLISTEDHALILIHQYGKVMWSREEALASILSAEILDLPLSETDAKIEQEFGVSNANLINMLLTRLTTQALQLQSVLYNTLSGLQGKTESGDEESGINLIRDKFGLHKVIVAATFPGKLYGIDSVTGKIVWNVFIENMSPFGMESNAYLSLFIQRTTAHFPYPPQCSLLGKHKMTGKGYLFSFNPITGKTIDNEILPYQVLQAMILGFVDKNYLKGILILDTELKAHVFPESSLEVLEENKDVHYVVTADPETNIVSGYNLAFTKSNELQALEVWRVSLSNKIIKYLAKRPTEHVHSQGRVMGDRSVLYKYLNPNLIVIITEGMDVTQKPFLNIFLLDGVTGLIVYSAVHKRAKSPVQVVHSENWAVYSYYNEKSRRLEMSSIELYEGKSQSNTTAFSSLAPPPLPLVEHQTYIFPSVIETMSDTVTERGMTSKHLLIALPSGGIIELPKSFLDPRRPIHPTPEHREEGLIPYVPELPLPSEGIINYNQSVLRVRGIQTASSGLESTCLVFIFGLDLFHTRVTPSKTFDILKDDFDHYLISAVLLGLLFFSYVSKKLAAKKALKAAWK